MNNFIIYLIESAVCLSVFYVVYWLFLKNETFFKLNRFYLLISLIVSLILPSAHVPVNFDGAEDSWIGKYLTSPVQHFRHEFRGKDKAWQQIAEGSESEKAGKAIAAQESLNINSNTDGSVIAANNSGSGLTTANLMKVLLLLYFAGAAILFLRFALGVVKILLYSRKHQQYSFDGTLVIRSDENISPFSFLNLVFIGKTDYPDAELQKIIQHEKVHISQRHSADIIAIELLTAFQWFNPFVWMYRRDIKVTHEFLADEGTLHAGIDMSSYQCSLLNQVLVQNNFKPGSTYNLKIKKRINMMMKKRSSKAAMLKVGIALPCALLLFSAFGLDAKLNSKNEVEQAKSVLPAITDTSIKYKAPLEYLNLLEGEYISTNEGNVRHIIFTEIMGTLYGYDNGYTYMLKAVAEGRFVNPDDNANLIFDTRDNKAITLNLFGKVNLKKIDVPAGTPANQSLAAKLVKAALADGPDAVERDYKKLHAQSNYYLTESEMNLVGYHLMQAGKLEVSAAILKLNIELYPKSYNTYDSYAEVLLMMGDKSGSMENYKKSLEFNPGNRSAIAHLKEMGVNTDKLIKTVKVSEDHLKLLAGDYLSTDQPKGLRWIALTPEDGTLVGDDNGYRYKLIPMSNNEFVNPDDGVRLVFDTKDKKNITMLIFGNVHMKKVKTAQSPALILSEYAGIYLPEPYAGVMKKMEIITDNQKLYRYIAEEPVETNRKVALQIVTQDMFFYTDRSNRSIEFIVTDNKVTGCIVRRWDGTYKFSKQK